MFYGSVFVDIARRNALTSRVWFELSWLTVFCMMEFGKSSLTPHLLSGLLIIVNLLEAGAVAVSAIMPHSLCDVTGLSMTLPMREEPC